MSTIKMSKLRFVGLLKDKNKIVDELYKMSNAHISHITQKNGLKQFQVADEQKKLEEEQKIVKRVISYVLSVTKNECQNKINCSFEEFIAQQKNEETIKALINEVNEKINSIATNYGEIAKLKQSIMELIPIEVLKLASHNIEKKESKTINKIDEEITKDIVDNIYSLISKNETDLINNYEKLNFKFSTDNKLFIFMKLKREEYEIVEKELNLLNVCLNINKEQEEFIQISYEFKKNSFVYDEYNAKNIENMLNQIANLEEEIAGLFVKLKNYENKTNIFKMYSDYITYKLEQLNLEKNMVCTQSTFMLECYIESSNVKQIISMYEQKFNNLVITEEKITAEDSPPTKTKNPKFANQASFVVDMYSVPKYGEVDPTFSVFLFFMIFFGFIMADVGYGIVLVVLGYLLAHKNKNNAGAYKLWKLIGTGGIFAIVWGILFGSVFGFSNAELSIIPVGIMPNPQTDAITLLLVCLLMGVLQIAYGYILKGINHFKQGHICSGIFNGFAWTLFLIGVILGTSNYLLSFFNIEVSATFKNILVTSEQIGLYVMIFSLVLGVIFAGVGTRGFTKFTKSFSALYGIINLFSDILSYARLFGLMLSGAVIAQQFNAIALSLMTSPLGVVFGVIVLLIGHAFNVSMSALSAYIHDVRLQYVEYFGKFYSGEGVTFEPFGAKLQYVQFNN